MRIEVDPASAVPPFEQLRSQFAAMITSGALEPGTQLPTIRQLASDLGLAANTVARTYRELEAAGLVRSRVRHGTVVTGRQRSPAQTAAALDEAAQRFAETAQMLGVGTQEALQAVTRRLRT